LQAIASGDTLPKIVKSMEFEYPKGFIYVPAAKAMSSLSAINDTFVMDKIIYEGVLKKLFDFLCDREKVSGCLMEVFLILSNICASGP
jgi:hypothetical protein